MYAWGTWEIVQYIEHLPCKQKYQSSVFNIHVKNSGVEVCDYNSCTREIEAGGPMWLAGQFWQIRKLQVLCLTLSLKIKVLID